MTREDELQAALSRLEYTAYRLTQLAEDVGELLLTFQRLLQEPKGPDFDYRTGQRPKQTGGAG